MGERGAKRQYMATLVVNLYMFGTGMFQGWSQMENEYYWEQFGASLLSPIVLFTHGGLIGTIVFGIASMKDGRKVQLSHIYILVIISCLLNLFVRNFYCFQVSMFLMGIFNGAVQNIAPLYLAEISNDRFRGAMVSSLTLSILAGQFLALIGKMIFDQAFAILCSIIPLTVIAAISIWGYFPDTPLYFIKRNDEKKAEESVRFYKNIPKTDAYQVETFEELAKMKKVVNGDDLEANQMFSLRWADFKTEHARKALRIGIVLVLLNTCNGSLYIVYHSTMTFDMAGLRDLSLGISKVSMLSVFSIIFVAKLTAMQMVDHIGRKVLMMASAIGATLGFLAYSLYAIPSTLGFETGFRLYNWIPLISTFWIIFFSSLGLQSLTFTIATEIMPEKIKDVGLTFCGALFWSLTLLNIVFCRFVIDYLGMVFILIVSAIICLAGAIYIHLKIPETRGKNHQEIRKLF